MDSGDSNSGPHACSAIVLIGTIVLDPLPSLEDNFEDERLLCARHCQKTAILSGPSVHSIAFYIFDKYAKEEAKTLRIKGIYSMSHG